MIEENLDLKFLIRRCGLRHWQVAKAVGISEATFARWIREQLTPEREKRINTAIEQLRREGCA